jgi:pimeloyl-[acyl-carrier protein] methyl ester esterase
MVNRQLVLLPGLDGTGELFTDFIAALPSSLVARAVEYPRDKFLSYSQLFSIVGDAVPLEDPFVLLAESFSTPLAASYAAIMPENLVGLILCAGFVTNPIGHLSIVVKALAQPGIFKLRPPDKILEHFLAGDGAPPELLDNLRAVLQTVSPEVLSGRVKEVLNCDARGDLARTTVPLLDLRAANDRLLSSSCHRQILAARPDATIEAIEGPHLLAQRQPNRVAMAVAEFLGCGLDQALDPTT